MTLRLCRLWGGAKAAREVGKFVFTRSKFCRLPSDVNLPNKAWGTVSLLFPYPMATPIPKWDMFPDLPTQAAFGWNWSEVTKEQLQKAGERRFRIASFG